jgi:dolichol-phosphate mannosyltransferase
MEERVKLSVIIPVFNEGNTILEVIRRVEAVPIEKEIIIVDDGSTDGTRELLKCLVGANDCFSSRGEKVNGNINLILKEKNEGKGEAIREGLKHLTGDIVVIQDADLEYEPMDWMRMLEVMDAQKTSVVYGSRFGLKSNRFYLSSKIANRFLTLLTNIIFLSNLTDMETCYKMISSTTFLSLNLEAKGFEIEPEITCAILKGKHKIHEVPIRYIARGKIEGKKICWRDGVKAIFFIIKYRIAKS